MNSNRVEWGVAERHKPGESLSGDLHLVKPLETGVLLAVADGLGHGQAAAEAARLALSAVEEHSNKPLVEIMQSCSRKLQGTRGAVMSMALLSTLDNTMEWLGVGNVEGVLVRSAPNGKPARESLLLSRGVLGGQLPLLRTFALEVSRGDTLIFATDGIQRGFEDGMVLLKGPQETARFILERDGLGTDDALVLVATFQGRQQ
ncbi:MAG TPA: SpoIIE family protein phosphatase [Terriglobia bacterium]|nr:SpoIIE family protein phosphatase [Terriglobia bacterium]